MQVNGRAGDPLDRHSCITVDDAYRHMIGGRASEVSLLIAGDPAKHPVPRVLRDEPEERVGISGNGQNRLELDPYIMSKTAHFTKKRLI